MSSPPRDRILTGIRAALHRGPPSEETLDALDRRLAAHSAHVVPAIARGTRETLLARFAATVEASGATLDSVPRERLAEAVARVLRDHDLPTTVAVAADPRLDPVAEHPGLTVSGRGAPTATDGVGVAHALVGIAETGTLMLASGPHSPSTLTVLPETHIVAVGTADVVGGLEDAWTRLRAAYPGGLPRTLHLVTGPSRTGDIEQTIQLGAHGPRRLHVVLLEDDDADAAGV